jgi:hypothetical protein
MTRLEYLKRSQLKIDHMVECEKAYEALPRWRLFARQRAFDALTTAMSEARLALRIHDALWPGH